MSWIADLSGNESDVTVQLEYSDSTSDRDISAPPHNLKEDSDSDDCSLDFGSDSGDTSDHAFVATKKSIYTSIDYYTTQTEAEQSLHGLNGFTLYLSPFVLGKVYQCRSHVGCNHRIKLAIHRANENSFRYQLLQRGQHCGCITRRPARGISPVLKPEIDALLRLGMSAGRVRNMLLFKYTHDPNMLLHVPVVRKMENRKAYLKKQANGATRQWTARRLCQDRESYQSVLEANLAEMNAPIVLDDFEHTFSDGDRQVSSIGMIITTRDLLSNVRRAVCDQGTDLVLSTDGKYRIHFGGWTLVDCGDKSVEMTNSGFVQRFRPWLYMFVRTKSTFAYEKVFRALIKYTKEFFDVEVPVRSASIDHSDAIASALEIVWPEVEILTCWEHLLRHSRNQSKLATSNNFIKDHLQPHLRMLHAEAVPSSIKACIEGVERFERADWLQSVYLYPRWERWSVGSSSIPGFLPTQQPIESHYRVIKVIVTDYKKALMISVLNSVLPRALLYDATNLSSRSRCHYAEGPLLLAAVMMSKDFLIDPQNHRVVNAMATQRPVRIFFNSTTSMVHVKNLAGATVSAARTERFQRSLRGWMGDEAPIDEIQAIFLSLHQVTVNDGLLAEMEPLPIRSKWLLAEIRSIRSTLSCTYKRYMHSGWVCAHIIASLYLLKKLDIERALESIPIHGQPGRPRSLPSSLQRDGSTDVYDVDRLINLFTKEPGRPLK
ncbi:hypothetical protein P3T76_014910 [Phytophthora citrophthora]|uniref:MULE transposase domain-containing protein n=1 Tax=Phytophthora citrophthora TaxID=4793 RepID=A0AAD9LAT6_9STRA|nr:hypothetical protein P3T76_014910 [Phytophthora citrophthora]